MLRYLLAMLLLTFLTLNATAPYHPDPDWISSDSNQYSTGCIWSDINQDTYPDLVIANGNDMARQRLVVYYNSPQGLSQSIGWMSDDIDYHGHLDAGDVNGDGFPDIVVSVYIGETGFNSKGKVKLYLNNQGTLSSSPDWISEDSFYTFSCKLVDINLDAKPDLAVATGESYYNQPDSNRVYLNTGTIFENLPSWKSNRADCAYDVNFADFDHNGYPDLVFVNSLQSNQVYFNYNGILETQASWNSSDTLCNANSLSLGDINNDSYIDLAVSDNNQMAQSGHFKIYQNNQGQLGDSPVWVSDYNDYGSGIELFSYAENGFDHLIAGGWWTPLHFYQNDNGIFTFLSDWVSNTESVVERIALSDANLDGIHHQMYEIAGQSGIQFYNLPHKHLNAIDSVYYGGSKLNLNQYAGFLENGSLSVSFSPADDSLFQIYYQWSDKKEIAVSNWGNYPNMVFYWQNQPDSNDETLQPLTDFRFKAYPNPFKISEKKQINIEINSKKDSNYKLSIFNVKGQKISHFEEKRIGSGISQVSYTLNANELASGIYFLKMESSNESQLKKILILK